MRTWTEMRRTYVNARLQELQGVTPPLQANWRQQHKDQAHAEFNGFVRAEIAAAIEADRAQHREQALSILATDDAVDQILDGMGIDWSVYEPNRDQVAQALAEMGLLVADSINAHREADRAQRALSMSDPLIELREWASTVSQFMAEDKSNDWREEIAQLEVIEERLNGVE